MFEDAMESHHTRMEAMDILVDILCDATPDEDKPVIEALRNQRRVIDLTRKVLDHVKESFEADDRAIPRERAIRVNAVFLPIIETLEQFLNENA
jgi:hypothetical protein